MRKIYCGDLELRRCFLNFGGVQIIYECLTSGDTDIIHEILFNIEDLIYKDEDEISLNKGKYDSFSKIVLIEIVNDLIKVNIPKMLYDVYTV